MTTVNSANNLNISLKDVEQYLNMNGSIFGSSYTNSIFSAVQGVSDITSDDSQKKASGIQNIMNLVFSLINSKLSAEKETSESRDKIENGKKLGEQTQKTIQEEIDEIIASVGDNVESIEKALKAIEKLSGEDSDGLAGLQEQLEEQKEKIENAIVVLNNSKDKKEITDALKTIADCQAIISSLVGQVDGITKEIENQTDIVAGLTTTIEAQQGDAEKLLEDGLKAIEGIILDTSKEGVTNVSYIAKGGTEVAEGMEIQAAAAATTVGTLGVGAGIAAEAETKAIDLIEAGEIHISEGGSNLTSLGSALAGLGNSMKDVSAYSTAIGSALNTAQEVIGSYSTTANDLITATGSWSTIKTANDELTDAVKNYNGENDEKEADKDALLQFNVQEKFKLGGVQA